MGSYLLGIYSVEVGEVNADVPLAICLLHHDYIKYPFWVGLSDEATSSNLSTAVIAFWCLGANFASFA